MGIFDKLFRILEENESAEKAYRRLTNDKIIDRTCEIEEIIESLTENTYWINKRGE